MDAKTFVDQFGKAEAERVATASGTNYEYFMQIARGTRRPSVNLAYRLAANSNRTMSVIDLLPPSEIAA